MADSDEPKSQTTPCACRGLDAYDCFAARYNIHSWAHTDFDLLGQEPTLRELVDIQGGPCKCYCHYEDSYDEEC